MEDTFHLGDKNNTHYFYASGWQVFKKNKNAATLSIFCLGGGAGAGSGENNANPALVKNGSGGGGSSSYTVAVFPAQLLPDTMYIYVGLGGSGGTANATMAGQEGELSYVSITPNSKLATDVVCISGTATAKGSLGATQLGGVGGTVATPTVANFLKLSTYYTVAGLQGGSGGITTTAGVSITALTSSVVTPGAGGGGSDATNGADGGTCWGRGGLPTAIGGDGNLNWGSGGTHGTFVLQPFCAQSGSGGGGRGNTTGSGGDGGNGSFGCGGGGGGGGSTAQGGGGKGGDGGNGLIIITSY